MQARAAELDKEVEVLRQRVMENANAEERLAFFQMQLGTCLFCFSSAMRRGGYRSNVIPHEIGGGHSTRNRLVSR